MLLLNLYQNINFIRKYLSRNEWKDISTENIKTFMVFVLRIPTFSFEIWEMSSITYLAKGGIEPNYSCYSLSPWLPFRVRRKRYPLELATMLGRLPPFYFSILRQRCFFMTDFFGSLGALLACSCNHEAQTLSAILFSQWKLTLQKVDETGCWLKSVTNDNP